MSHSNLVYDQKLITNTIRKDFCYLTISSLSFHTISSCWTFYCLFEITDHQWNFLLTDLRIFLIYENNYVELVNLYLCHLPAYCALEGITHSLSKALSAGTLAHWHTGTRLSYLTSCPVKPKFSWKKCTVCLPSPMMSGWSSALEEMKGLAVSCDTQSTRPDLPTVLVWYFWLRKQL